VIPSSARSMSLLRSVLPTWTWPPSFRLLSFGESDRIAAEEDDVDDDNNDEGPRRLLLLLLSPLLLLRVPPMDDQLSNPDTFQACNKQFIRRDLNTSSSNTGTKFMMMVFLCVLCKSFFL